MDRKSRKSPGYDVDTEAYSYTELSEVIDDFDVVLAAPGDENVMRR